jgi:hypothetical protein
MQNIAGAKLGVQLVDAFDRDAAARRAGYEGLHARTDRICRAAAESAGPRANR